MGINSANLIIAIIASYGMGLLACLTPCVYPLIPITLSIFGAKNENSRIRAFLLSLSYVSGIALTYTLIGIATVKLGIVFGAFLGNPIVVLSICLVFLLLALHTLGIVEIPFGAMQSKASLCGGTGISGAFIMGIVSGGVAAPCVGPVLAILLIEVAHSNDMLRSILMLLAYSFGLGTPFLILGTWSSLLNSLPKSGNWLYIIKFVIAVGLFTEIIFLISALFEDGGIFPQNSSLWSVIFVVSLILGIYSVKIQKSTLQAIFAGFIALSIIQYLSPAHAKTDSAAVQWFDSKDAAIDKAQKENRIVMVDLSARWCVACKELEHTFSDENVAKAIQSSIIAAKIDFTTETPTTEAITSQYGVVGLPCILFLKPNGDEIQNSRITGKISPEEFLKHLSKIQSDKLMETKT